MTVKAMEKAAVKYDVCPAHSGAADPHRFVSNLYGYFTGLGKSITWINMLPG